MAWPPPNFPLAVGKTNLTAQVDDHPAHHNALATTANDTVGEVNSLRGRTTSLETRTTAIEQPSWVTNGRLATGAVSNSKIADGAVTSAKIAANTIVAGNIAASAVGNSELAADAVTGAKIANEAVSTEHILSGAFPFTTTTNGHWSPYRWTRIGRVVLIQGDINSSSADMGGSLTHTSVATIVPDARPAAAVRVPITSATGYGVLTFNTNGTATWTVSAHAASFSFVAVYMAASA